MCAAANLGYGLHNEIPSTGCLAAANSGLKSIDRNYILVKNYISLINVIYIQLKNMSSLLVAWLIMKYHHL
jgi:hypothetical protein